MNFQLLGDLRGQLAAALGVGAADVPVLTADLCPPGMKADITLNGFHLAKALRRPPPVLAETVTALAKQHPDVADAVCVKAFINITLKPAALFRDTVGDPDAIANAARLPEAERRRIVIEFSAPNTNKPQHLGHVRNNTLGMATAGILSAAGHLVTPVNLINDRGIHICKSMLAYQRFGNGETPASSGKKGDHLVGDYYVRFDQEYRRQLAELKAARPDLAGKESDELFLETELGRAAQDMLLAWEKADPAVRQLWATMNSWVISGFNETYARMGVRFDQVFLESQTYTLGRDIIQDGLARGVFQKRADGAVVIDLESDKLGQKVVLRGDGTSVYITQDIGTTLLKQREFSPDRQLWVVGDEQIHHFRVLFAILRRLGYAWAADCHHMAYGMVNLPSGRMKSREGTVVDADDLFDEMTTLARQAIVERSEGAPPADLEARAQAIGLGALKFMLLKVNPKTTILFDPEASVKFEGDTGPYVQYAGARIRSMLRKAGPDALAGAVDWSVLGEPAEKELALRCAGYGAAVRQAAADLDSSGLATYLLDLAKAFSHFYHDCPVLNAPTPALRRARLELSDRAHRVLSAGLQALTITPLDSM